MIRWWESDVRPYSAHNQHAEHTKPVILIAAHTQCCTHLTLHKHFQCTLSLHLLRSAHSAHIKFCTHSMHITLNSAHSGQNQWCTICKHTLWHTSSLLLVHYRLSIKGTLQCLNVHRTLFVHCTNACIYNFPFSLHMAPNACMYIVHCLYSAYIVHCSQRTPSETEYTIAHNFVSLDPYLLHSQQNKLIFVGCDKNDWRCTGQLLTCSYVWPKCWMYDKAFVWFFFLRETHTCAILLFCIVVSIASNSGLAGVDWSERCSSQKEVELSPSDILFSITVVIISISTILLSII